MKFPSKKLNKFRKIRQEKERKLIENLNQHFIKASLEFDIPINLILDNTKIHTTNITKKAMKNS